MIIKDAIQNLKNKTSLSSEQIQNVFDEIFKQKVTEEEVRDFLISLYQKGETANEIYGAAKYLRDQGISIQSRHQDLIDCCGTGGDQKNTFNFSTTVSFVLAGAGCHVAKHGNRSVSSNSGSADIFQELGIPIDLNPEEALSCLDQVGITFLFAPTFYPLMKVVGPIRKSIPHRTIFNLLGPLLNPAGANHQLLGVYDPKYVDVIAEVLLKLGAKRAVVVSSLDGMDEFSLTANAKVALIKEGKIETFEFDPRESGYPYCQLDELKGESPKENAMRLKQVLKGHSQALDHMVHINAAWGLVAAEKADSFMDGLLLAQQSISSGKAYQKMEEMKAFIEKARS